MVRMCSFILFEGSHAHHFVLQTLAVDNETFAEHIFHFVELRADLIRVQSRHVDLINSSFETLSRLGQKS